MPSIPLNDKGDRLRGYVYQGSALVECIGHELKVEQAVEGGEWRDTEPLSVPVSLP